MAKNADEIFLMKDKHLEHLHSREMKEGLFGKTLEDALQTLLEKYPEIIPGKQIDPGADDPPRFVLLRREMPVGGWSLDHLYVDQRGVLTLIETKLFQNPESRREVIGQIIEYAANAFDMWANGRARQHAIEFWSKKNKTIDDVLRDGFGAELDIENFWKTVEDNLKTGHIRMIVAADELRPEVRRAIEYLYREMQNAEVLGLEIKCYGKEAESMVLVPWLVGQSQAGRDRRAPVDVSLWTRDRLAEAYRQMADRKRGERLLRVLEWAANAKMLAESRSKRQTPGFSLAGAVGGGIVSFGSGGDIYLHFGEKNFAGGVEQRDKLLDALKAIRMLDQDLDPQKVRDGRNLTKKIHELTEEELERLLGIFHDCCH